MDPNVEGNDITIRKPAWAAATNILKPSSRRKDAAYKKFFAFSKKVDQKLASENVQKARRHLLHLAWEDTHSGVGSAHPMKLHLKNRMPDFTSGNEVQPCIFCELKKMGVSLDSPEGEARQSPAWP